MTLRRAFINQVPPKRKTFFLIRHGESKWNEAKAKINIGGMLDRDHPLTELGIRQAADLNQRWKLHHLLTKEQSVDLRTKKASTAEQPIPDDTVANLLDGYDELSNLAKSMDTTNSVLNTASDSEKTDIWSQETTAAHIQRLEQFIKVDEDNIGVNSIESDEENDEENDDDNDVPERSTRERANTDMWEELVMDATKPKGETNKDELIKQFHQAKPALTMDETGTENKEVIESRRSEYIKLFMHADKVYSSPLTRALETAVLSMEGHPALLAQGLTIYSVIREVKRIGGLDTVGVEYGEGIENRLRSELAAVLGVSRTDELLAVPIEYNDADQTWWTPLAGHDNDREQQERIREFLTYSRYCDAQLPVFVGHSLFFKAFYSKRVSNELLKNRRTLSENLKKFRLSNASMLAVTVRYLDVEGGASEAIMIDADLIFGGSFHGVPQENNATQGNNNLSGKSDGNSSGNINYKVGPAVQRNDSDSNLFSTLKKDLESKSKAVSKGLQGMSKRIQDFLDG